MKLLIINEFDFDAVQSFCLPRFLDGFGMRSFDFDSQIGAKEICGGG
jgi:hypothetical protein